VSARGAMGRLMSLIAYLENQGAAHAVMYGEQRII